MGALLRHEQIKTTDAKAKELRRHIEKLITTARRGVQSDDDGRLVHARRICMSRLPDRAAVDKLFAMLSEDGGEDAGRFNDRPGGYTRITPLYRRLGDNAHIVQIAFVE